MKTIESNPIIDRLPPHLKQFIKPQNYQGYTAINQAVWRYVMRKSIAYLGKVAHESYLNGLTKTGISIDAIPSMYGMNRILKDIGWAAVAVDGFIPPNAFMEFQAYKVLVIASDIRQLENIEYTPAPDIIHEAAGHAPIIANPDYAEYLRRFGEIGAKAILSSHDNDMYEAVRKLSILKEAAAVQQEEIDEAEQRVEELQNKEVPLSEMAKIRNLHWWSVEYGLIGSIEKPKLYGAGLLSSIGESEWCMSDKVKKLPFTIKAVDQNFDITKPQPQLFVTPDFSYLMEVLEEFAGTMALRKGGFRGLQKLIESKKIGTIELNTGLQISGVFTRMLLNEDNDVIFFKTSGPSALAFREKELIGHGTKAYPNGICSPLGSLKGINLAIENMGPKDLKAYHFYDGEYLSFEYDSGIKVAGVNITGIRNVYGKLMLIRLKECTVSYQEEILFRPNDGILDLLVGSTIASAYAGSADFMSFDKLYHVSSTKTIQKEHSKETLKLEALYQQIRNLREQDNFEADQISSIFDTLKSNYPDEWLSLLELYELSIKLDSASLDSKIRAELKVRMDNNEAISKLITSGLALLDAH